MVVLFENKLSYVIDMILRNSWPVIESKANSYHFTTCRKVFTLITYKQEDKLLERFKDLLLTLFITSSIC